MFDPQVLKKDFPILQRQVHGQQLVYLDNAATAQKPQAVIDAISEYYQQHNANVHRGVHQLSDESTTVFEQAHQQIAGFLGAAREELILTRNTTEAINGVVYGWLQRTLQPGEVILTTVMEHHANLVTWQQAARSAGASVEYVQVTPDGLLDLADFQEKVAKHDQQLRLVALSHVSNALGTVNPVPEIQEMLAQTQARLLIDGAQAVPHLPVNFHQLGADFYAFSGHKMLGPMGIGGLLVKKDLLQSGQFQPWLFGGGMIGEVYLDHTTFNDDLCERYVAGTPDVASTVGLAAAVEYLQKIGMTKVEQHDRSLVAYALEGLAQVPEVTVVGPTDPTHRLGSVAFIHRQAHAHDVAQVLDSQGIAVRSGHHCTMPLHSQFQWPATVRASFQVYNTTADIDALVVGLEKVTKIFA